MLLISYVVHVALPGMARRLRSYITCLYMSWHWHSYKPLSPSIPYDPNGPASSESLTVCFFPARFVSS